MSSLISFIVWFNAAISLLFGWLREPIGFLSPGLFLVVVSAALGVLMLAVFKYTSNQAAIGRARDRIKAHLLSMKLFRDNLSVVFRAQLKIGWNVLLLLVHSLFPMLVMVIPFALLLGQLGLWYQSRPLKVGEQAVLVLQLADSVQDSMPPVSLEPSDAARVTIGPVHVPSKRQICWQIQVEREGYHQLTFQVNEHQVQKELAVGDGFMAVSTIRPGPDPVEIILNPAEEPFDAASPVQSIRINYPDRVSGFDGTDNWILLLFMVSMAAAFLCKPLLNVKL